ncbi:hypothetical protein [Desulforamulus putei]|uniref:Uncharacterized protein n=1 Tax=Desulforamulus putei DSM 12395 TaxID=1121429 RepID=A0A1M4XDC8_9FIRM|nr:hypothetical protein [Desulforamulus putei]SHE91547.1 hypothetical protein SAMN02745133_01411 [Desulforamulus putei DSM 12395]
MFKEYRQIVDRISSLDKPLSALTKSQRNEVLNLTIRQEELEKQIGDEVRKSFKELQEGLDVVAEWVRLMQEDAIKALGIDGTPEEVLALEETLAQANSLNSQISALTLASYSTINKTDTDTEPVNAESTPEPGMVSEADKTREKLSLPIIHSTIDMVENSEQEKVVARVIEEISESVVAAAPTYLSDIFNQPRITTQKTRPAKRKKR